MRSLAYWLSLGLIFVIPWENSILLGSSETTVARVVGLVVAGFWILTVVVTGEFRKPHPFHIAIYLFVLWNVLSFFWSVDVDLTLGRLQTYFQLAGLTLILWDLYTAPAALKAGLQAYVLGAYVAIGGTIVNYLARVETYYLRYAATGFDTNDLGIMLSLGIPVAWHLAVSSDDGERIRLLRVVNFGYIPVAILAILLTASRASFISMLPALLYILATSTRLRLRSRALIFALLVGALLALQPLVPRSSLERLATTGESLAQADLGGRVDIWRRGLAVFSEHPLLGVGTGGFLALIGSSSHSTFLSVLVDVGLIGFVLFVFILAITLHQAARQPKWDARFWLTVLLIWSLGAFSLGWERRKQTWLFLSLVVVSASLSVRRDESGLVSTGSFGSNKVLKKAR